MDCNLIDNSRSKLILCYSTTRSNRSRKQSWQNNNYSNQSRPQKARSNTFICSKRASYQRAWHMLILGSAHKNVVYYGMATMDTRHFFSSSKIAFCVVENLQDLDWDEFRKKYLLQFSFFCCTASILNYRRTRDL